MGLVVDNLAAQEASGRAPFARVAFAAPSVRALLQKRRLDKAHLGDSLQLGDTAARHTVEDSLRLASARPVVDKPEELRPADNNSPDWPSPAASAVTEAVRYPANPGLLMDQLKPAR